MNRTFVILVLLLSLAGCSEIDLEEVIARNEFDTIVMFNGTKTSMVMKSDILDDYYNLIDNIELVSLSEKEFEELTESSDSNSNIIRCAFLDSKASEKDASAVVLLIEPNGNSYIFKGSYSTPEIYRVVENRDYEQFRVVINENVENELIVE